MTEIVTRLEKFSLDSRQLAIRIVIPYRNSWLPGGPEPSQVLPRQTAPDKAFRRHFGNGAGPGFGL